MKTSECDLIHLASAHNQQVKYNCVLFGNWELSFCFWTVSIFDFLDVSPHRGVEEMWGNGIWPCNQCYHVYWWTRCAYTWVSTASIWWVQLKHSLVHQLIESCLLYSVERFFQKSSKFHVYPILWQNLLYDVWFLLRPRPLKFILSPKDISNFSEYLLFHPDIQLMHITAYHMPHIYGEKFDI